MFPRFPEQRSRNRRLLPVVLLVLAAAALVFGWMRDDTGFMVLGAVGIAGALLSLASSWLVHREAPPPDTEGPD